MSNQQQEITRKFSKTITLNSLKTFFAAAFLGLLWDGEHTAEILQALGTWVVAMLAIYMSIGYLDFRTVKGMPSFWDNLLGLVFSGRRRDRKPEGEEG